MRNILRVLIFTVILLQIFIGAPLYQIGDCIGCKESWAQSSSPYSDPVDIYFLLDLSGNLADDLDQLKAEAPGILSQLTTKYSDIRFGIGRFEDYPIPPFGNTYFADKAYERVLDLTADVDLTLDTINSLTVHSGGDEFESQLAALFQAVTGTGQDLTSQGYRLAGIAADQQANFREDALKLFIVLTDSPFHEPGDEGAIPYPGPSFIDTASAVNSLSNAKVLGISSGTDGLSHLQTIVSSSGAMASENGVDCNTDGIIDIAEGEPLVCTTALSGEGISDAVLAVINGAISENETTYPNLRITQVNIPDTIGTPSQIDAEWLVINDGPGSAEGPWSEKIFLSEDDSLDEQDTLVGEFVFSDNIDPDAVLWRTVTLDFPEITQGQYYIIVQADAGNEIGESEENDNSIISVVNFLRIKQFIAAPDKIKITLYPGETSDGEIDLVNLGDTPLTGITASTEGDSSNISIQIDPPSVIAGKSVQKANYSVSASDESTANNSPVLTFVSAEGKTASVTFNITVNPGYPKLVSEPAYLETTMVRGTRSLMEFEVSNIGSAAVTNLKTVLPSTDWLSLYTPENIESLEGGEKMKVGLVLNPADDLPLGPYTGNLALNADNTGLSVGFSFTAVSDKIGGLKITATDEFTYFADDHPPVTGASVKISNPYDGTLVAEGITDESGEFLNEDLAEGFYNVVVKAEKHGTYNATIQIYPGQTREITAFLPRKLVTYNWTVEPIDTEDRYIIDLEAEFETHVPAPVVTIEPALLDLSELEYDADGKATVNYTISNHGLIAASSASIHFGSHPDYEMIPLNENIGEIGALTSVIMPVTVQKTSSALMSASAGDDNTSESECVIQACVHYVYVCVDERWVATCVQVETRECPSIKTPGTDGGGSSKNKPKKQKTEDDEGDGDDETEEDCLECGGTSIIGPLIWEMIPCEPEDSEPCIDCPTHFDCVTCENDICIYDGCGDGPGDDSCVPSCGECTRCSNGECVPNDTCEGDGSCDQTCDTCYVCRNGECVRDARCDLNDGDGEDESDTRDEGPDGDNPIVTTGSGSGTDANQSNDSSDPNDKSSTHPNSDLKGDPVLLFSGELLVETTDLRIPGRGFDFEFKRTYRSRYESNGVLGHGWEHNHMNRLIFPANNSQIVIRSNGFSRLDIYESLGNGRFKSPDSFLDDLRRNDDGTYTLRNFDGTITNFSAGSITQPARMVSREDRFGNRMQYIYDDSPLGFPGPLAKVIDTLGRTIEFGYNDQGRLITVKDFTGRIVRFTYDRRGDLIRARTPVVTGTSTDNNFSAGKTTYYEYYHDPFWVLNPQLKRLEHNLLSIWDPKGQNYLNVTYGTSTGSYEYDRVIEQQHGTANQINYLSYTKLNEDIPSLPYDPNIARNETVMIDRNGNRTVNIHNGRGQLLEERVETNRSINPDDPGEFITTHTYNDDGNRLSTTFPEGNQVVYVFDTANPDRLQQGNLLSVTRLPGPRGGDQTAIKTTYTYEPIYNQVRSVVAARGNDASFVPQNGGNTSQSRYSTLNTFDYQEASSFSSIPNLASAINRDETEVESILTAAGIPMGLGDVNGDGITSQIAGNVVQKIQPTVNLLSDSKQASIEGDTTQEIVFNFIYNRFGQITSEIDPEGNVDEFFYYPERDPDGDGTVTPAAGLANDTGGYKREIIRDSSISSRRRSTEPPTHISNQWKYDPVGNVIETIDGRGNSTRYIVNSLNKIERIISEAPFNYEHTYIYDANDNVVREEIQNTGTNGPGLDASVTYTYDYDILDNKIKKTEEVSTSETLTTRYEYDDNENQTRIILPEGNVVERVYDERDLVFSITRGAGSALASTQTFTYDGNGNLVRTVDAEDNNGDGVGETTLVSYDGYDRKIQAVDAVGNVSEYSYDPAGNIIRERSFGLNGGTSPANNTGSGNVLLKDVEYSYDELSRTFETNDLLFANTRPVGPEGLLTPNDGKVTSRQEYDRNSRLTRTLDDNIHEFEIEYDGADRAVFEVDELGNEVRKTYDGNSNIITIVELEISPDGLVPDEIFTTHFEYDTLDRKTAFIDNLNNRTEYQYDSRNNLIGTTDALGNTKTFTYDGINRKLSDIVDLRVGGLGTGVIDTGNTANPDGKISRLYDWDGNSRLVSETDDKGNITKYEYDSLDRRFQETYADNTTKTFTYDKDDNLIQYKDQNGSVAINTYDGINRHVRKVFNRAVGVEGTTEQRFEYDGISRRTRAFDNNDPANGTDDSEVSFHYDSLNRIIAEVQDGVEVTSRFDGVGNLLGLTYPNSRQLDIIYDSLDRIESIKNHGSTDTIASYKYIGPARALERTYANGTRLLFHDDNGNDIGYDELKRTVKIDHKNTATLFAGFIYAYDKQHNRRYELDQFMSVADVYEYDSAYRLTRTQTKVPSVAVAGIANNNTTNADVEDLTGINAIGYTLDGVGNWDSLSVDTSTTTYAVNVMNEYDDIGGTSQVHDDNGNLIDDGIFRYIYDMNNRLIRVTDAINTEIARYYYDASNRRIEKHAGSDSTLYLYNQTQVIEERDGSGITTKQFVYGSEIDEVLGLTTGGQTYFYHENSIGSIVSLTNATGDVVERYRYSAYGETTVLAPDGVTEIGERLIDNPYRFTGRRYDTETDIYYYRARFYDPERGRFLQRDPKGYVDGMGLYEYVRSNPLNFNDPYGTTAKSSTAGNPTEGTTVTPNPSLTDLLNNKENAETRSENQLIQEIIRKLNERDNDKFRYLGYSVSASEYIAKTAHLIVLRLHKTVKITDLAHEYLVGGGFYSKSFKVTSKASKTLGRLSIALGAVDATLEWSNYMEVSQRWAAGQASTSELIGAGFSTIGKTVTVPFGTTFVTDIGHFVGNKLYDATHPSR